MGVFIGKGIVRAAEINESTGLVSGPYRDLGEVENFAPGADIQTLEKRTNRDSSNALIARIETQIDSKLTIVLNEPSLDNLNLILRGTKYTQAANPITGEVLHEGTLAVNDSVFTKHPIQTFTALKDSAGSPVTVTGGHYSVDTSSGKITILNLSTYVQPFKADYTPKAYSGVTALTAAAKYYRLRIDGINLVDSLKFIAEYYKVRVSPATEFPLIAEQFAQYTLEGAALRDETKGADAVLGYYGRFIQGLT